MDLCLRKSVYVLITLCLCFIGRLRAQRANLNNLDIQEPIVRVSPAADTDLFGWATVLHQIEAPLVSDDLNGAAGKTRIIIGAPNGTFPGGLPLNDPGQMAENQTGLVYSCPVLPGECEGIRGDLSLYINSPDNDMSADRLTAPLDIEGRLFDQAPNALILSPSSGIRLPYEIKTGQLMGATLFSDGDNLIACAPRWTDTRFTSIDAQPRGACFASGRGLTNFQILQPCQSGGSSSNTRGAGYCMAGVSATRVGNLYAVAAPGYDFLQGAIYYGENRADITSGRGQSQEPDFQGNLVTITDQYQGFQTTTGFISQARDPSDPSQTPDHIATVPRYNGTTYTGRVNIYDIANIQQQLDITAVGQQMGEFFGYSVVAADLNGDGFDELVVGAPMYTDIHLAAVERGRVYVFNNTRGNLSSDSVILEGQVTRGRFGTSVTNLGDIDDDGYEDIAIGAPYVDMGSNNQGSVYIYYGRADIMEFGQQIPFEIRAEQVVNNVQGLDELRTFGWSLSSGVDVDNNQYRDLSIGAYESKTVVLLRTLPVASVNVTLDGVPEVNLDVSSCILGPCFNVTLRATYTGRGLSGALDIGYTLSENTTATNGTILPRRLVFDTQNSSEVTRTLHFTNASVEFVDTVTVYIRTNVSDTMTPYKLQIEIQDIARPTRTDVDGNQTLTDLSDFPRLRQIGAPNNNTTTVTAQGCEQHTLCSDCIAAPNCTWCSDAGEEYCFRRSSTVPCSQVKDPRGGVTNLQETISGNPISIENVRLNLRVGEPQTFTVQVTPRRDLPLDLYVLMDLSNSMSDELETVRAITGQIATRIRCVTDNVRLGFGSFNDKVTRPFTRDTCGGDYTNCPLYAFRHHLDLTSDIDLFTDAIQAVSTTINVDNPENGLEALAQVLSCEEIIGWRSRSATGPERGLARVVLFLTDAGFHYSGEGRLAGILRPYDGQCYLERNASTQLPFEYRRWDEFDYPSVGHIIDLLTQFEVVTIFAIAQNMLPTYQILRDLVNQKYHARAAVLESNTANFLNLVEIEYRAILQEISLRPPVTDDLNFSIQVTCPTGAIQRSDGSCDSVLLETTVNFTVSVTLNSCEDFRSEDTPNVVRVRVPSLGGFNITYTGVCSCDFEQSVSSSLSRLSPSPTNTPTLPPPTVSPDLWPVLFAPLAVILLVLLIVVVGAVVYIKRRRNLLTKESEDKRMEGVSEADLSVPLRGILPHRMIIPRSILKLHNSIGQGEFGVVYKAHLQWYPDAATEVVAVKTLKGLFTPNDVDNLVQEVLKMHTLSHPNVMSLTGVCLDGGGGPAVVMPYMDNGSVLHFLKKEREKLVPPDDADCSVISDVQTQLLGMCLQISKGMEYLAKEKIVHRDLAARNCMMDASGVVKVADFGLSEDIYASTYYRQGKSDTAVKLPVKWMPPESIVDGIFTEKSDVWSFGVTCWEVFTGGHIPYSGIRPVALLQLLRSGERLDKPMNPACSDEIYLIIQECWNEDPKGRPDFSKLVDTISLTLEAAAGYMDFSLRIKGELPVATEVEVKTMAGDSNMQSPNELEGGREQETAM